jgi:hypothetical protein
MVKTVKRWSPSESVVIGVRRMGIFGTIGTLGQPSEPDDAEEPESPPPKKAVRSFSVESPPHTGTRRSSARRERRQPIEDAERVTLRMLRFNMRMQGRPLSPGRAHVVIGIDGRQWTVGLHWARRSVGANAGWRPYFKCDACKRRCCALFPTERGAVCRVCADLTYKCRTLSNKRRQVARVMKLRRRQDCPCTVDELMWQKVPFRRRKGQRRSVYSLREARHFRAWSRVKAHQLRLKRLKRRHPAWRHV